MNYRFAHPVSLVIVFAGLLAGPVSAGTLYRSVSSSGTVVFTDVPPADAVVVAQVSIGGTAGAANSTTRHYNTIPSDEALAQANSRVDLAEHNLAVARRSIAVNELNLGSERRAPNERARVESYKRDLQIAHSSLTDLLRQRAPQPPPTLTADGQS
ncbi:MAG TPA: DUF4124 domain-containing protein [Usitatibacter sp.]